MSAARQAIREFLSRTIRGREIADDDDIFALGLVNSLYAMQLVTFLESHFAIQIENEDLELEHFRSVEAMAAFVQRKKA